MRNKKGFALTEVLVVTVFLVTIFMFVYSTIIPLFGKYEDLVYKQKDIDIVYKLYHIRKMLLADKSLIGVFDRPVKSITCDNLSNKEYCTNLMQQLGLNNYSLIYVEDIHANYNDVSKLDEEIVNYLEKYQYYNDCIILLLDKDNHSITHLRMDMTESFFAEITGPRCYTSVAYDSYVINRNMTDSEANACAEFLTSSNIWIYSSNRKDDCLNRQEKFQEMIEKHEFTDEQLAYMESKNIVISNGIGVSIIDYDESCGDNVNIPSTISSKKIGTFSYNENATEEEIEKCIDIYAGNDAGDSIREEANLFCRGENYDEGMNIREYASNFVFDNYHYYWSDVKRIMRLVKANVMINNSEYVIGNVTNIGDFSFANKKIKNLTIPSSVQYIDPLAFYYNRMNKVNINMPYINKNAFYNSTGCEVSDIGSDKSTSTQNQVDNIKNNVTPKLPDEFYDTCVTNIYIKELVLGNEVISIGDSAFSANEMEKVSFRSNLKTIGSGAFINNSLTSLTLPSSLVEIKANAFTNNFLENILIPNSVTSIGESCFANNKLTRVNIPNRLERIESAVFRDNQLTSINLPSSLTAIFPSAFSGNKLTSVTIPDSVKYIDLYAFSNNNLTSVKIGNGVTSIGDYAFAYNNISNLELGEMINTIGNYAFANNSLTSLTLPSRVATINNNAFAYNKLQTVNFNPGLVYIRDYAFRGGTSTDYDGKIYGPNEISSVTIPASVRAFDCKAFYGIPGITVNYGNSSLTCNS